MLWLFLICVLCACVRYACDSVCDMVGVLWCVLRGVACVPLHCACLVFGC